MFFSDAPSLPHCGTAQEMFFQKWLALHGSTLHLIDQCVDQSNFAPMDAPRCPLPIEKNDYVYITFCSRVIRNTTNLTIGGIENLAQVLS
jgi:hypothetical protein